MGLDNGGRVTVIDLGDAVVLLPPGPQHRAKLSAPVKALPTSMQEQFRAQLISLPPEIEVLHLRDLAWSMADLQHRHRQLGHQLSAAMVEALAAAHALGADIAVSEHDVGPNLRAASVHDGISFYML